tara:strand:- start:364 stop:504 length:141 start_codon:yes stop_codon:yes gene_type:complete
MQNLWDYKRNSIFSVSDKEMFDFVISASQVLNIIADKVREFLTREK